MRSVSHLQDDSDVADQVTQLQKLEAELEKGHSDFISLSQLGLDLVIKLDCSNDTDAAMIRQQIEAVTQRWDNIVAQIDDHSHMVPLSNIFFEQFKTGFSLLDLLQSSVTYHDAS